MNSAIQGWLGLPTIGLAVAVILAVISPRLTASSANGLLVFAFFLACFSIYGLPYVANRPRIPRILLTTLAASMVGLGLYHFRWIEPPELQHGVRQYGENPPEPEPRAMSVFDARPAEWRLAHRPNDLSLHDLFLLDFKSEPQNAYGAVFVDKAKTIRVQYGIHYDLPARAKFLSFFVGRDDAHTADTCAYLARQCDWLLRNATQLLIKEKLPGESNSVSTEETVFSGRVFIYHETYLPEDATVGLTKLYKSHGLSVVFRGTGYLSTKRMEANIIKLRSQKGVRQ